MLFPFQIEHTFSSLYMYSWLTIPTFDWKVSVWFRLKFSYETQKNWYQIQYSEILKSGHLRKNQQGLFIANMFLFSNWKLNNRNQDLHKIWFYFPLKLCLRYKSLDLLYILSLVLIWLGSIPPQEWHDLFIKMIVGNQCIPT